MSIDIHHDSARGRFVHVDPGTGLECECDYRLQGQVMTLFHTGVPPALGGRGLAAELVREALRYAADHRLQVNPRCSYVEAYMRRHPDTLALLEPRP